MTPDEDELAALQTALAGEHAVVWGYAVAGARLTGAELAAVKAADAAHRARRDAVAGLVRARNADPVTAEPSYELPTPVADRAGALKLCALLEDGAAASWRYVVGSAATAAVRKGAVIALTDSAVRATRWRLIYDPARAAQAFPGGTS